MRWLIALGMAVLLGGCATVTPQDYAKETPKLDLATYFNGKVDGWGMVQDRSGKVLRRMYVELDCMIEPAHSVRPGTRCRMQDRRRSGRRTFGDDTTR